MQNLAIEDFLKNHKFDFQAAEAAGFKFGEPQKIRVNWHLPRTGYEGIGRKVGDYTWIVSTDNGDHIVRNTGGNLTFPF